MANITKRISKSGETSYLVRFFIDEKQISKTWKTEKKMSEQSMQKAVEKWATIYEDQLHKGLVSVDSSTRFADYAARWMESSQLAPTTRARYDDLLKRINAEIGHMRLDRLQAHHLEAFYQQLRESGAKDKGRYAVSNSLGALLKSASYLKMLSDEWRVFQPLQSARLVPISE